MPPLRGRRQWHRSPLASRNACARTSWSRLLPDRESARAPPGGCPRHRTYVPRRSACGFLSRTDDAARWFASNLARMDRETQLARGRLPGLDRATIHPYVDAEPGPYYYQRFAHPVGVEAERVLGELEGGDTLL